jgi:hypothetical protein
MDAESYRVLDLVVKGLTVLLAVIGGSIGMWKYFDTSKKEFRRPYWERQLSLYFEVTTAAATLASIDSGKIGAANREELRAQALEKFWQLYYGPLEIVTDEQVTKSIMEFKKCLIERQAGHLTPRDLEIQSLELARACRSSIGESWNIELSELRNV